MLVLSLSHGVCFSLNWTAAVSVASCEASEHMQATAQSFIQSVYFMIGGGLGNVAWGECHE